MKPRIEHGLSVYLDLIRVTSALIVMVAHAQVSGLIPVVPGSLELAPAAVIVFFALSGFIIESTTDPDAGLRQYAINRAARIYSVVLPALLVSYLLAGGFAWYSGPSEWRAFVLEWGQWWRIPVVVLFQAEDWFQAVEVPSDGPFWSLNYEVFYYILYGAIAFLKGRQRALAVVVIALVGGPKIALLLPCWWIGVELARRPDLKYPTRRIAWIALFASPTVLVAFIMATIPGRVVYYVKQVIPDIFALDHSVQFITDYIVGIFVIAGFVAARQLRFSPDSFLVRGGKPVAWLAGFTFSIYLLHRPFQHLLAQFYQFSAGDAPRAIELQTVILAIIILIGTFTERRNREWRRAFGRLMRRRRELENQG